MVIAQPRTGIFVHTNVATIQTNQIRTYLLFIESFEICKAREKKKVECPNGGPNFIVCEWIVGTQKTGPDLHMEMNHFHSAQSWMNARGLDIDSGLDPVDSEWPVREREHNVHHSKFEH